MKLEFFSSFTMEERRRRKGGNGTGVWRSVGEVEIKQVLIEKPVIKRTGGGEGKLKTIEQHEHLG